MRSLVLRALDLLLLPATYASSILLKFIRTRGVDRMPLSKAVFNAVGVFPIRKHYYEPLFDPSELRASLRADRALTGVDLNDEVQLRLLDRFAFTDELKQIPLHRTGENRFYYNNGTFCSGDAEYLYSMIRLYRPRRVVEIGSGYSSLMAQEAIRRNSAVDPDYRCEHICIEPYENPWLAGLDVTLVRERVEEVDRALFGRLTSKDILFIDSSHIIRPQGDVVCEYLEILPTLAPGVLVHVHDIFTPRDYLDGWVRDQVLFWNEQYLLEAFLSHNSRFEIIGAVNYLAHHYQSRLAEKCPIFAMQAESREPGSFWLRVVDASDGARAGDLPA